MSGFDVQMRSDALIQQNRQFYDAQKHDAMSQMGASIAQTGNALTQIMMQVQSRDMEARMRAQEMEINRQLQVEKLGMMREVHDVQMQQTQVEAAKLQVEAAKFEFEQRRKMMEADRDEARFGAEMAPYMPDDYLYSQGRGWMSRSQMSEDEIRYAEPMTQALRGRGEAMAQERMRDSDPEQEKRLRAQALAQAYMISGTGQWLSDAAKTEFDRLMGIEREPAKTQDTAVEIDTSKATGLPDGYAERAQSVLRNPERRANVIRYMGLDEAVLDSTFKAALEDENHPLRDIILGYLTRVTGDVTEEQKAKFMQKQQMRPMSGSGQ